MRIKFAPHSVILKKNPITIRQNPRRTKTKRIIAAKTEKILKTLNIKAHSPPPYIYQANLLYVRVVGGLIFRMC